MSSKTYEKYANWHSSNKPYIIAAVAAIIMFILIAPIIQKGDSMSPTVDDGNVLILNKKTFSENRGLPEYEDVVVFSVDFYEGTDKGAHRVGRVMGLPGDTMEVRDGDVYRNGKKLEHKSYEKGKTTGSIASTLVGENEIFLLCDNRSNSVDSRNTEVGNLNLKDIRGRALFIIWPFSNFGAVK